MDLKNKKILVTGGNGFLGPYLIDNLTRKRGLALKNIFVPTSRDLDLRLWSDCQKAVANRDVVFHLAAHLGGGDYQQQAPAKIFYDNVIMSTQLMEAARQVGVKKFVTIGSVASYPEKLKPPFLEKYFWQGFPEAVNYAYAMAKKLSVVQARAYQQQYGFSAIHLVLPNLFGPLIGHSHSFASHAIPIFITKLLEAQKNKEKEIVFLGSGKAVREFLYVEDAAEAILVATEHYNGSDLLNLGPGETVAINQLVKKISQLMNLKVKIKWNGDKKVSDSKRFLDSHRFQQLTGFRSKVNLAAGLKKTISYVQSRS